MSKSKQQTLPNKRATERESAITTDQQAAPTKSHADIELIARKEADRGRNQAIGIVAFVSMLLSVLTGLGVYQSLKPEVARVVLASLEDEGVYALLFKTRQAADSIEKAQQSANTTAEQIEQLSSDLEWLRALHAPGKTLARSNSILDKVISSSDETSRSAGRRIAEVTVQLAERQSVILFGLAIIDVKTTGDLPPSLIGLVRNNKRLGAVSAQRIRGEVVHSLTWFDSPGAGTFTYAIECTIPVVNESPTITAETKHVELMVVSLN